MKWLVLGAAAPMLGVVAAILPTHLETVAQTPARVQRGTTDPDRADWQPNARLNPKKPVQVVFTNHCGETFRYTLMGHTDVRELAKGQSTRLDKVLLPAYIAVNPVRDRINIRYKMPVQNNVVYLDVKPAKGVGQRALAMDAKGNIYAY